MGRNSLVTSEKIIAVARDLFSRYGFQKTTVEDIANALHVGKSSLYYHFRDKEDVFRAVIDQDILKIKDQVTRSLESIDEPAQKLHTYAVMRMRFFKEYAAFFNAFLDDYLQHYAFVQKLRESYDAYERKLIGSILEEGVRRGRFDIRDIELTSSTIFATLKGMEYEWAIKYDASVIEKNLDALFGILLYGIMKR